MRLPNSTGAAMDGLNTQEVEKRALLDRSEYDAVIKRLKELGASYEGIMSVKHLLLRKGCEILFRDRDEGGRIAKLTAEGAVRRKQEGRGNAQRQGNNKTEN